MILCLGLTPAVQRAMAFDHLTLDAVNRARQVRESSAGKAVNVARVIHQLGHPTLALGFAGGPRGDFLLRDLHASGVPADFVRVTPETRLCTTLIDDAGRSVTELVEESSSVNPADYDHVQRKLADHLPGAQILTLSGTLPPGAPADFYHRCITLARRFNVDSLLDAQKQPLLASLSARPLLVKPNRSELAAALQRPLDSPDDLRAAMRSVLEQGAQSIVVTAGADGAFALNGRASLRITVPQLAAINPIGSGDAFAAGLAVSLAAGRDAFADALRLGAAAAVANVLTDLAGHVRLEDVQRLKDQVRIQPW